METGAGEEWALVAPRRSLGRALHKSSVNLLFLISPRSILDDPRHVPTSHSNIHRWDRADYKWRQVSAGVV